MIGRLAAAAAIHGAAGVAFGVTSVLAACTLAQVARKGMNRSGVFASSRMPDLPSSPFVPTGATSAGQTRTTVSPPVPAR